MPKRKLRPTDDSTRQKLGRVGRHPFLVPAITFMVLFFVVIAGFINLGGTTVGASDTRVVSLTIDGEETTIPTRADTVGDLLERLDIPVGEKDIVSPGLDTPIEDDGFSINLYRARTVKVVDGANEAVIYTAEPSPAAVATTVGFTVYPEDILLETPASTDATNVLNEGVVAEQLIIHRATLATLNLYGTPLPVRSQAATVGEMLEDKDVRLNEGDTLLPEASTPLTEGLLVYVLRVGTQIVQVEEPIVPPTEYVDDYDLVLGSTRVKEAGTPGKKMVTYEVVQDNGIETSRKVLQEVVVQQPVRQVVGRGRKAPVVAGNKAEIMTSAGIPSNQHYAADFIIGHESGWRVNALNSRGCAGLGQACPGTKLSNSCPNWQSDAVCQMRFFNGYAVGRYGSWTRALEVWQAQGWW